MSESDLSQSISTTGPKQVWKINDLKAQKTGTRRTNFWVKTKKPEEDGKIKGEKWIPGSRYIGDWADNEKHGYGVYYYSNGNKYEGQWEHGKRHGRGTLWQATPKGLEKYKRVYTGDWYQNKKTGRGTYFYDNEDRYDGFWLNNLPHGEGRMIYETGDIYEGQWINGKREGYGTYTKANGDHFEGSWIGDKKEGQGSYFYAGKNKLYIGEWVEDIPKCGIYSEVVDEEAYTGPKRKYFTDPYDLPSIPTLELSDPNTVINDAVEDVRKQRVEWEDISVRDEEDLTEEDSESVN